MEYTIKKLAELAGVSARTLRYYDEIGLLAPTRVTTAGYRIYGRAEVDRLQQILFYREMNVALEDIKQILDSPTFDVVHALEQHRAVLQEERSRIDHLLRTIDQTVAVAKGEEKMTDQEKFAAFKKKKLDRNEELYGGEIRSKYVEETVEMSNQNYASMNEEDFNKMEQLNDSILERLKDSLGIVEPTSVEGIAIASLHKEWLSFTWPTYSKEAHRGLAEMYVMDERFTAYYDERAGSGAAQFLRDAIVAFTE